MDEDANKITIEAYENGLEQYNLTDMAVVGDMKAWINKSLAMLHLNSRILEIGSGHGRDALYIESKGFKVERTDAAHSFVNYLQEQGYGASVLNVITDDLGGPYDMIFAHAVLLHFTVEHIKDVMRKIKDALNPGGIFSFSMKIGEGSVWSDAKLNSKRYYTFWQEEPLRKLLKDTGLEISYFEKGQTGKNNKGWFCVIARKPDIQ